MVDNITFNTVLMIAYAIDVVFSVVEGDTQKYICHGAEG